MTTQVFQPTRSYRKLLSISILTRWYDFILGPAEQRLVIPTEPSAPILSQTMDGEDNVEAKYEADNQVLSHMDGKSNP